MAPPHGNRPGGSGRPPSDRGPYRGPGGPSGPGGPKGGPGGGQRGDQPRRDHAQRADGPRPPRPDGPRPDFKSPRSDFKGPRPQGQGPRPQNQAPHDAPRPPRPPGSQQLQAPRPPQTARADHRPPRPQPQDAQRHHAPEVPKGTVWLYGLHAVAAALANPSRRLRRLLVTEDAEATLTERLKQPWPLAPERTERPRLDQLLGRDIAHQGVALLADPLAPPSLTHTLERPGPLLVLDQVTDPRNVGAILRSAAAFGAAGVITQDRNAPEENGALAKAASGALETVPLLRAVNIARTLIALKAANIWCIGLDSGGTALSGPGLADRRLALVLGAEGTGLRRLTRDTCDMIAGLSIQGAMESLNVSAAAAVALYEITRTS